jgi:hypothetical protein
MRMESCAVLIEQPLTLTLPVMFCLQVPQRHVKLVILDSIAALLRTD